MPVIAAFDDSHWKQQLAVYKQAVIASKPQREPLLPVAPVIDREPPSVYLLPKGQRQPVKPPLETLSLPQKPPVNVEGSIYRGIHQIVHATRRIQRLAAKAWADKWLDPFTYFDEDETPYNDTGGIHIDRAKLLVWAVFSPVSHVEGECMLNLYTRALNAHAKVVYLQPVMVAPPINIISLPMVELSRYPRFCAYCGTKTSSGIRALCDQHHHRFIIDANYKNSGTSHDEIARLMIQADNQHRQTVMAARLLKTA